jgi:RHS repeat-associated protein
LPSSLEDNLSFPIQDFRSNICALKRLDGSLAEWIRYSAFGEKTILGNQQGLFNPWRFANRREIADLSLFTHRFYNPSLMRWLITDPLGFKDGLNFYAYVHNNPFCYKDPDELAAFAIAIPVLTWVFNSVITAVTLTEIAYALVAAGTFLALNNVDKLTDKENQSADLVDTQEEQRLAKDKKHRTNPFDGSVEEDVIVIDSAGNAIKISQGNWLTGTKDGKWIQERTPDGTKKWISYRSSERWRA